MSEVKNIPEGWLETTLGEICNPKGGKRLPKGMTLVNYKTNHPYIRITDFNGNQINKHQLQYVTDDIFKHISRYIVNKNDVIITIVGTVGLVAQIDRELDKASLTENCTKLVDLKNVDSTYLYYFLISKNGQDEIVKNTVGAVQKKLPIYGVQNINITLPTSITVQKSIAAILTAFDDKIELLQAQNKTLEETAQTIFTEWCGKYSIDDELPDGYKFGTLGEVSFNHSKTFKFKNEKVVFVNTGDVLEGQFLHSNEISPIGLPGQAKKAIELYDIFYSEIRPKNKRFAFVDFDTSNYVVSTKFMIIRPKNDFSPFILYLILKKQDTIDEFNIVAESRSGTFPQITFDSVKSFPILILSKQKQNEFDDLLIPIMEKKKINHQQIQTLTKTRDELLPRLMSGEVRVKM